MLTLDITGTLMRVRILNSVYSHLVLLGIISMSYFVISDYVLLLTKGE